MLVGAETLSKIIDWKDSYKLPWGIILLFGGGLSLAAAMQGSGLTLWIGEKIYSLDNISLILIILSIVFVVNFLTWCNLLFCIAPSFIRVNMRFNNKPIES